ncbi:hypothetical protein VKS41_005962 [Umbelopsis sp. WA50703]
MYGIIASAVLFSTASAVVTNYTSTVDPTKITLPNIPQDTTSDFQTACVWTTPPVPFVATDWPTSWQPATTNGMNLTSEFQALYNSIDWTQAPQIAPRNLSAPGVLDTTGYDTVNDPDCWWTATGCVTPKFPGVLKDISACSEPETWGLTYDDGPNCTHNGFYDFLQQQNLKASLFYIGSNVYDWPYQAQRGVKDGHHISVHTWSHPMITTFDNQNALAELYYATKMIKYVLGLTPLYWRPPLGDVDDRIRWIASQLNLTAIMWNLDTDDWAAGTTVTVQQVEQNYQNFITMGSNGSFANSGNIVLSHELNNMTMSFAETYVPQILKAYKNVVDVATCMNITNPYVENSVTFPVFTSNSSGSTSPSASGTSGSSSSRYTSNIHANAAVIVAILFAYWTFV